MRSHITIAALAFSALALTGCGQPAEEEPAAPPRTEEQPGPEPQPAPEPQAPASADTGEIRSYEGLFGEWTVETIGGETLAGEVEAPTLTVTEDGRVYGFAGVNRYRGVLAPTGALLFGPLAATRMAGSEEAMQLEDRFIEAVSKASRYEIDGERLTLGAEGETVVEFRHTGPAGDEPAAGGDAAEADGGEAADGGGGAGGG